MSTLQKFKAKIFQQKFPNLRMCILLLWTLLVLTASPKYRITCFITTDFYLTILCLYCIL